MTVSGVQYVVMGVGGSNVDTCCSCKTAGTCTATAANGMSKFAVNAQGFASFSASKSSLVMKVYNADTQAMTYTATFTNPRNVTAVPASVPSTTPTLLPVFSSPPTVTPKTVTSSAPESTVASSVPAALTTTTYPTTSTSTISFLFTADQGTGDAEQKKVATFVSIYLTSDSLLHTCHTNAIHAVL